MLPRSRERERDCRRGGYSRQQSLYADVMSGRKPRPDPDLRVAHAAAGTACTARALVDHTTSHTVDNGDMTTSEPHKTEIAADTSETDTRVDIHGPCAACAHPRSVHDALS